MWSIKFSLVARDTVCSTIAAGGLRIQRLGCFNQALMGKWLCDLGLRSHIYGDPIVTKYVEEWVGWTSGSVRVPHMYSLWRSISGG